MFCVKCGTELSDDSRFCSKCGFSVLNNSIIESSNEEEQTLIVVAANLFRGIEAVGGRLKITTKRLIFDSHLINVQCGTTEIPLSNIEYLEKAKSLGIINNQMVVVLKGGVKYKFVLNNRDNVIGVIEKEIKKYRMG